MTHQSDQLDQSDPSDPIAPIEFNLRTDYRHCREEHRVIMTINQTLSAELREYPRRHFRFEEIGVTNTVTYAEPHTLVYLGYFTTVLIKSMMYSK